MDWIELGTHVAEKGDPSKKKPNGYGLDLVGNVPGASLISLWWRGMRMGAKKWEASACPGAGARRCAVRTTARAAFLIAIFL
jgi:hypothetical protein